MESEDGRNLEDKTNYSGSCDNQSNGRRCEGRSDNNADFSGSSLSFQDEEILNEAGPSGFCAERLHSNHVYESSGSEYHPDDSGSESYGDDNEENEDQPGQFQLESEDGLTNDDNRNSTSTRVKTFAMKPKISRKRSRNPESWRRRAAQISRAKGESYTSYNGIAIPAKSPCLGCLRTEKCRLKCSSKFNAGERTRMLNDFHNLSVDSKNALLFRSITPLNVARVRTNATKHKLHSYKYSVVLNNQQIFVCKAAFCSLHQISRKKVDVIKAKLATGQSAPSKDARGRHANRPHKMSEAVEQDIMDHISKFPTEESHYSRNSNPHKRYLAPNLNMSIMYRLYIEECMQQNKPDNFLIKKSTYAKVFCTKFNLSFSHPKSDTCSKCDSGESDEIHQENIKLGFELMSKDRETALKDKNTCYITVDLQQTMPLPKLTTSKAFYLRQIWFYNLGIHVITTEGHKSVMQTWTEDVAGRGSREVVSCLWNFVRTCENAKSKRKLLVWSDSCSGQKKNFQMICLHQLLILKGIFEVIDHKFPEVGHTYLDSDRDFGRIEKVLRTHSKIYTPEQYRRIIKSACTKQSTVNDMEQYFRNVDDLPKKLGLVNKKKNVMNEKVAFRDGIKWIRFEEFGSYLYKESYDEYTPFKKVTLLKHPLDSLVPADVEFHRSHNKSGGISQEKIDNIREQLPYIDEEHRGFYEKIIGADTENQNRKRRRTK